MQVNSVHLNEYGWTNLQNIYNPEFNARLAYHIYLNRQQTSGNGWTAWYAVQGILWK